MPSALSILIATKALIATPATWTHKAFARNPLGNSVSPTDQDACQWCLVGALRKSCDGLQCQPDELYSLSDEIYNRLYNIASKVKLKLTVKYDMTLLSEAYTLDSMNDKLGFEFVQQLLDETIAACQAASTF